MRPDARLLSFWGMSCIFLCHPHLTRITVLTAVWAQACGLESKNTCVIIVHLWTLATVLVCVLVKRRQYHRTANSVKGSETGDPQLVAEPGVGRNHEWAMGKSRRGHRSATTVWTRSTSELLSASSGVLLPPNGSAISDFGKRPHHCRRTGGWMAFAPAQKREPDSSRDCHGRCAGAGRRYRFDRGGTGATLGGHARPGQGVEDREGPLRDSEGRQDGKYLRVPRTWRGGNSMFNSWTKRLGSHCQR